MLVQTQMFHHLRDANLVPEEILCHRSELLSCNDRWRPSPRWSPRWVHRIALAAGATTCRVALSPRSKAVHGGLHNGRLIDSSGHERTGWKCKKHREQTAHFECLSQNGCGREGGEHARHETHGGCACGETTRSPTNSAGRSGNRPAGNCLAGSGTGSDETSRARERSSQKSEAAGRKDSNEQDPVGEPEQHCEQHTGAEVGAGTYGFFQKKTRRKSSRKAARLCLMRSNRSSAQIGANWTKQ